MNWQIIDKENLSLFNPQIVSLSFWAFNNFLVSLSLDPLIFVYTPLSDLYISRLFVIIRINLFFLNKYITLCQTLDIKRFLKVLPCGILSLLCYFTYYMQKSIHCCLAQNLLKWYKKSYLKENKVTKQEHKSSVWINKWNHKMQHNTMIVLIWTTNTHCIPISKYKNKNTIFRSTISYNK